MAKRQLGRQRPCSAQQTKTEERIKKKRKKDSGEERKHRFGGKCACVCGSRLAELERTSRHAARPRRSWRKIKEFETHMPRSESNNFRWQTEKCYTYFLRMHTETLLFFFCYFNKLFVAFRGKFNLPDYEWKQ